LNLRAPESGYGKSLRSAILVNSTLLSISTLVALSLTALKKIFPPADKKGAIYKVVVTAFMKNLFVCISVAIKNQDQWNLNLVIRT
jgi:hypothetical protein